MNIRKLSDDLSVCAQVGISDLEAIRAAGFGSIICNRPDGEDSGQPSFHETRTAAQTQGLEARHQPIVPGKISEDDVVTFRALVSELPKPVLAYCRTGARSSSLWTKMTGK